MLNLQRLISTTHSAARHCDGVIEHGLIKGIFIWSFAFEGTLGIGRGNWDRNMALSGLVVNGWRKVLGPSTQERLSLWTILRTRRSNIYRKSLWLVPRSARGFGGNYWGGGSTTSLIFRAVFYWRGTVLRWLGITPEFICITRTCVCYTCHMVAVFGAVRSP